jgi:SnoaL-like protein
MWLPEFQDVLDRAGARLDEASLELRVDDPQYGTIDGEAAFDPYSRSSEEWLRARDADVRTIATTVGERRTVAVVVEPDGEAEGFWVRIYHSQWPLLGHHVIRQPLLAKDPTVRESDVVGEYQAALAVGDVGRIVATFEPDGCFREPAGGDFRVCGTAALLELFTRFFGAGGGITLEHCTATEDGVRTALEFNAVRWGSVDMTHQAGVAVYERGRTGKLAEARIYDDVEGPVE